MHTPIDTCGIAWRPAGITSVQPHEPTGEGTRARLQRSRLQPEPKGDPPPAVRRAAITGVQALLNGEPRQPLALELDMARLPPFQRRAYAIDRAVARANPPGQTHP